ncbi:MAG TPA: S1 RNA-binding domain-containing protein, partial [Candidatus Krumholzibacteria bacterium]
MLDGTSGSSRSEQTSTKGGAGLRSPAYALFETLDAEAAAVEATGRAAGAALIPGYEATIITFEEGQIVRGTVTGIRENEVIVDVGFKSEGTIPLQEFRSVDNLAVGDQFDVYLEKLENQEGLVVLSKEKADFFKVWGQIKDAHDNNQIVQGRVKRRIKGGLVVDLLGVDAFLPGSQIALRQVPNLDDLISQTLDFKIIKINKRRRNIVVSRRVVLEEKREELKKVLMGDLEPGQVREG